MKLEEKIFVLFFFSLSFRSYWSHQV